MSPATHPRPNVVVVPVKPPAVGKSRLGDLPADQRRDLAEAFALDTVEVALHTEGVAAVLVVTDDFQLAARLRETGCDVIPDGVADDLNATLVQAAAEVVRRWPGAVPVALCADLPGLVAHELRAVLDQVPATGSAFLRDRAGTGTTLYAADPDRFDPRFGQDSAAAHLASGAVEIVVLAPSVRADVDNLADLNAALVAGVGPHTAAATGRG
jgi:2-phospho-L-lactate guanylyltransferase